MTELKRVCGMQDVRQLQDQILKPRLASAD